MHDTPGAIELLKETHGERIPRQHSKLRRGADGRYRNDVTQTGAMAKWLPNVKVPVCSDCNNGWMARLEEQTKAILGPFVFENVRPLRLDGDALRTLATWATKSWMAYALLRAPHQNPFTVDEYRSMSRSPAPLARSQVWLLHSREAGAHVAMGIASSLLTFDGPPPDLGDAQDNWAYGYLAVSTVVLTMQLLPAEAPLDMADLFAPPTLDGAHLNLPSSAH